MNKRWADGVGEGEEWDDEENGGKLCGEHFGGFGVSISLMVYDELRLKIIH